MSIRLLAGDCRDVLPTLAADSVHTVVTSPPYYALRSYLDALHPDKHRELGSEATPEAYIAAMVGVFREVRRVLRRDGTCWVNVGDSYAGAAQYGAARSGEYLGDGGKAPLNVRNRNGVGFVNGAKPKDLLLMPARLALALQSDGWWVRSDIIWHKPNPMPESCTDRPTSSYEHVFLLTKSARYFYDNEAIREKVGEETRRSTEFRHAAYIHSKGYDNSVSVDSYSQRAEPSLVGRNLRNVWTLATYSFPGAHFATYPPELAERCVRAGTSERGCCAGCGAPWVRVTQRNLDNVPTRMATKRASVDCAALGAYLRERRQALGYSTNDLAAHFPSITGGLTGCVRNWELGLNTPLPEQWAKLKEILGLDDRFDQQIHGTVMITVIDSLPQDEVGVRPTWARHIVGPTTTTGWRAGCGCDAECVPCTVLDPFAGAGTTLLVADRLQRDAVGIELNVAYTEMAMERCRADAPLFTSFPPAEEPEDMRMRDLFDMAAD